MNIQTKVTTKDWEDFWYSPEKVGLWYPEDFTEKKDESLIENSRKPE